MSNNEINIDNANNSTVIGGDMDGNITNNKGDNQPKKGKRKNNIKLIEKIIDNKFSFIFILLIILSILIVYKN